MPLPKFRYIVVEGPIGVGKTSLTHRLAEHFAADTLLERPDENPFLARFYQDMPRWALPTQLFFLFQRMNQMRELKQLDLFSKLTVSDFLLDKDPLFARLTLGSDEMHLYQQIYDTLQPQAPKPDLVIYLQAPADVLVERVKKRAAEFEQGISVEYLAVLADSYSRFFYNYNASPILIVNSERLNFVKGDKDLALLIERITAMRGGREFFNFGD
jgi:deoxyguanosine kinase